MAYQKRRSGGGGGGGFLRSFLTSYIGGGNTTGINVPVGGAAEAGDVPFQYKGNPEDLLGQSGYVTQKGSYSPQPFTDTRGFFAKGFGAPNNAEDLNLGVAEQRALTPELLNREGALGRQKNALAVDQAKALTPVEYERQFSITAAQLGLTPQQLSSLSPDKVQTLLAQNNATRAKAAEEAAKSATGEQVANTTRSSNVAAAGSDAERAATIAKLLNQYSQDPTMQAALRAGALGGAMQPLVTAQKGLTTEVGPGQLISQPSLRSILGESPMSSLFGGVEAKGTTTEKRMIPGQPIGDTGLTTQPTESFRTIPGAIRREVPVDQEMLRSVLGEESNGPANEQQGQPPGFGVRSLTPQNAPTSRPSTSIPNTVYDLPPHITAQLNDPRFPDKAAIINNYYQSLIKNAGPGVGDELSNFLGETKDYKKKINAQAELRRLLTPNY